MKKIQNANWNYPTNIWFGFNRINDINIACKELGITNPLIITDKDLIDLTMIKDFLNTFQNNNLPYSLYGDIEPNPTNINVAQGVELYKSNKNDGVIAIGSNYAMDVAKSIAFMANQTLDIWEFEYTGYNYKKANTDIAPIIAIPTTSGTGSEASRTSSLVSAQDKSTKIIFHPKMLPSIAILDPTLTYELPSHITAWTGMDALTHSLEAYLAKGYHPIAEGIALKAIIMINRALPLAYKEPVNDNARSNMIAAACMGACALQKGLGCTHAIANQLVGLFNVPRGLANAILLPFTLIANEGVIKEKLKELCVILDIPNPSFNSFIEYITHMQKKLGIPKKLSEIKSIDKTKSKEISLLAMDDPSMAGNPKYLTQEQIEAVFLKAYDGKY